MKYLKKFTNHTKYEAYLVGSEFPETDGKPTVSLCKLENEVHYNKYIPSYNLLDILYANANGKKKVDSAILDPSLGYTPIGLCVASTGFFGADEKARWMSLKYISKSSPDTGLTTQEWLFWGNNGNDISTITNIQTTYNSGANWGYLTADWITETDNKIPALFTENNEWNISILGTVNTYAVTDIDGKNKTDKILTTATAQETWQTDSTITDNASTNYAPAVCGCWRYYTLGTQQGDWYLPACGELAIIIVQKTNINTKLAAINTIYPNYCMSSLNNGNYWTSTEYGGNHSYRIDISNGKITGGSRNERNQVIAILQY